MENFFKNVRKWGINKLEEIIQKRAATLEEAIKEYDEFVKEYKADYGENP